MALKSLRDHRSRGRLGGCDAPVEESPPDTLGNPGDCGEQDRQRDAKRKEKKPHNETNHWIEPHRRKMSNRIRISGKVRLKESKAWGKGFES